MAWLPIVDERHVKSRFFIIAIGRERERGRARGSLYYKTQSRQRLYSRKDRWLASDGDGDGNGNGNGRRGALNPVYKVCTGPESALAFAPSVFSSSALGLLPLLKRSSRAPRFYAVLSRQVCVRARTSSPLLSSSLLLCFFILALLRVTLSHIAKNAHDPKKIMKIYHANDGSDYIGERERERATVLSNNNNNITIHSQQMYHVQSA